MTRSKNRQGKLWALAAMVALGALATQTGCGIGVVGSGDGNERAAYQNPSRCGFDVGALPDPLRALLEQGRSDLDDSEALAYPARYQLNCTYSRKQWFGFAYCDCAEREIANSTETINDRVNAKIYAWMIESAERDCPTVDPAIDAEQGCLDWSSIDQLAEALDEQERAHAQQTYGCAGTEVSQLASCLKDALFGYAFVNSDNYETHLETLLRPSYELYSGKQPMTPEAIDAICAGQAAAYVGDVEAYAAEHPSGPPAPRETCGLPPDHPIWDSPDCVEMCSSGVMCTEQECQAACGAAPAGSAQDSDAQDDPSSADVSASEGSCGDPSDIEASSGERCTSEAVNLRAGPAWFDGPDAEAAQACYERVLATLDAHARVTALGLVRRGQWGDWAKVRAADGTEGWVAQRLTGPCDGQSSDDPPPADDDAPADNDGDDSPPPGSDDGSEDPPADSDGGCAMDEPTADPPCDPPMVFQYHNCLGPADTEAACCQRGGTACGFAVGSQGCLQRAFTRWKREGGSC